MGILVLSLEYEIYRAQLSKNLKLFLSNQENYLKNVSNHIFIPQKK